MQEPFFLMFLSITWRKKTSKQIYVSNDNFMYNKIYIGIQSFRIQCPTLGVYSCLTCKPKQLIGINCFVAGCQ